MMAAERELLSRTLRERHDYCVLVQLGQTVQDIRMLWPVVLMCNDKSVN